MKFCGSGKRNNVAKLAGQLRALAEAIGLVHPNRIQNYWFVSSFIEITILRRALKVWAKHISKVSVLWSLPEDGKTSSQGRDNWPAIQWVALPQQGFACWGFHPYDEIEVFACGDEYLADVVGCRAAVLVLSSLDRCCGVSGQGRSSLWEDRWASSSWRGWLGLV